MRARTVIPVFLAASLAACSAAPDPSVSAATPSPILASPTASPTAIPTPIPTASPTPTARPTRRPTPTPEPSPDGAEEVIVTFRTAGNEQFRILLIDADDIRLARRLLSGKEEGLIPNGRIVRGSDGGVNTGWSWHIDPEFVDFAQFCIEIYDGRPSYIENGTHTGGDQFCPWSAVVVAVEPAG